MANLKSSQKDIRRTERRTTRNIAAKSRLKTLGKKVHSLAGKPSPALQTAAREYVAALDKAVKTNIIHANKAARHKAQVAKLAKI